MTTKRTIQEYIDLIEEQFAKCVDKVGRTDLKWGVWSRSMNVEIRERIDAKDPEAALLSQVFNLWINYSQLLDLRMRYTGKIFGSNKIKQKIREIERVREFINEDLNS